MSGFIKNTLRHVDARLLIIIIIIFFYLDFLLQPFTNHRTAGERGRTFFNSSLPLPPAPQTLRH